MIRSYQVEIVDEDGGVIVFGHLSDNDGSISGSPGFDRELANKIFYSIDLAPEMAVRIRCGNPAHPVARRIAREALEVAERFGYWVLPFDF